MRGESKREVEKMLLELGENESSREFHTDTLVHLGLTFNEHSKAKHKVQYMPAVNITQIQSLTWAEAQHCCPCSHLGREGIWVYQAWCPDLVQGELYLHSSKADLITDQPDLT